MYIAGILHRIVMTLLNVNTGILFLRSNTCWSIQSIGGKFKDTIYNWFLKQTYNSGFLGSPSHLKSSDSGISCTMLQVTIKSGNCHQQSHFAKLRPSVARILRHRITLRIARPRNALWRAILRRATLSTSFIRIARPIYFVFYVLI